MIGHEKTPDESHRTLRPITPTVEKVTIASTELAAAVARKRA